MRQWLILGCLLYTSRQLGFSGCRVARAGRSPHAEKLFQWLERGWHAGMEWMARSPEPVSYTHLLDNHLPVQAAVFKDDHGRHEFLRAGYLAVLESVVGEKHYNCLKQGETKVSNVLASMIPIFGDDWFINKRISYLISIGKIDLVKKDNDYFGGSAIKLAKN